MLNCYSKWMIQNKKKKQHNIFSECISKVISPCTTDLGKPVKRILGNIVNELSSNLKLNQTQSYLQEKISYPPANVEV